MTYWTSVNKLIHVNTPDIDRYIESQFWFGVFQMLSVVFMKAPILRTADILSRRLSSVYLYSFEYYSNNSLYNLAFRMIQLIIGGEKPPTKPGICHADDLIYMFNLPFILSLKDQKFSRSYVELLRILLCMVIQLQALRMIIRSGQSMKAGEGIT